MKNQTRKGLLVTINPNQFLRQEKIELGHETYYAVYREDGSCFELRIAIPDIPTTIVDKKPKANRVDVGPSLTKESTLPRAEDCSSVSGPMCTIKKTDPHSAEKYKGETFYTHKSAPGLVIKKDDKVIHETKMEDMYKRRG